MFYIGVLAGVGIMLVVFVVTNVTTGLAEAKRYEKQLDRIAQIRHRNDV